MVAGDADAPAEHGPDGPGVAGPGDQPDQPQQGHHGQVGPDAGVELAAAGREAGRAQGRRRRRQVGGQDGEVGAGPGRPGRGHAVLELGEGQATGGVVVGQLVDRPVALGVADADGGVGRSRAERGRLGPVVAMHGSSPLRWRERVGG